LWISFIIQNNPRWQGFILTLPFFFICGKIMGIMAKKNNTKRKLVGLVSEESGVRAYYTKKNTMNTPDKLSLKKYDPVLRKHVVFTETKKNLGRNEVKEKKR
jgi:large subunit ribosomal protein L33